MRATAPRIGGDQTPSPPPDSFSVDLEHLRRDAIPVIARSVGNPQRSHLVASHRIIDEKPQRSCPGGDVPRRDQEPISFVTDDARVAWNTRCDKHGEPGSADRQRVRRSPRESLFGGGM